jgi:protocatechuate 3,4-dioxygenase beta subunit
MTDRDDHHHDPGHVHEHDRGLSHDLPTLLSRRRLLGVLGGAGALALAGCGVTGSATRTESAAPSASPPTSADSGSSTTTTEIPEETAGPYPGDGSNGVNVLTASGIVRSDITSSFGGASGVAEGVPLTIRLTVLDTGNGAVPLGGAAVYLWHCTMDGRYSLYDDTVKNENYLRGVQETDDSGVVTFTSIYPGAYSGRWPHIHFEVYPSPAAATSASDKLRTSQLALPEDTSNLVYATAGYQASGRNMQNSSLATDNVFSDGWSMQMAKVTGDVASGFTATLNVPV